MSDVSIPGVSSKFNTNKLIEDLMKLERVPLTRAEERIDEFELQKRNWQELNRDLARVQESAKKLYGFQNPFLNRLATSSNERVLSATASREAEEENRTVNVRQVATADRFLSNSLASDYKVEGGSYAFSIGEKEISFNYSGGSLSDFASTLERRSQGLLRASVVKNTPDTQVLLIEGTRTGTSNRIEFGEQARQFALDAGILERAVTNARTVVPSQSNVRSTGTSSGGSSISDGSLTLEPRTRREVSFSPPVVPQEGFVLQFSVTLERLSEEEYTPPAAPAGPETPDPGGVTLEDITLKNLGTSPSLPAWEPPAPPEKTLDMNILSLRGGGGTRNLAPLKDQEGAQTIRVPVTGDLSQIEALVIDNVNTHRRISVSSVELFDPNARGDTKPANAVTTAGNAIIEVDGIEVTRESNEIDDVIQGVTLNLKRPGDREVDLEISPDRQSVKDTIIEFVGYYNQLISQINIYSSNDDSVVNELDYLTDDERDKALEQLGLFQGESTLTQMKTRFQRIMMDPYTTRGGSEMALLAQIGISTNTATGGGLRASRLRGYLEIDEGQLDQALETHLESIKDLFGYDSNGDLIVDQGVAVATDGYINPYVQTGGIIAYKTSSIDGQIDRTNRDIDNLERSLERKEQQLRREYGMMEGALQQMEDNSQALQNLNNNSNQ